MALAITGLFVGALLFSFSSDSGNHLHFFKKANAFTLQYAYYAIPCPSGGYSYVCGPGSNDYCSTIGCP